MQSMAISGMPASIVIRRPEGGVAMTLRRTELPRDGDLPRALAHAGGRCEGGAETEKDGVQKLSTSKSVAAGPCFNLN